MLLIQDNEFTYHEEAYARGVRDLIPVEAELDEISARILELANYHRIHEQLKITFGSLGGSECIDEETGLYNADFFAHHMARVANDCRKKDKVLSLLALRPKAQNAEDVDAIYIRAGLAKIGGMIKNMIRMQDIIARFDDETYILAFPSATEAVVESILQRMTGLVDCAAFESGRQDNSAFTFHLAAAIVEQTAFDGSDVLIGKAISKIDQRPVEIEPASVAV